MDHICGMDDAEVDKDKIVLYGHSLGGAVALHLAALNVKRIAAVIVENTFVKLVLLSFMVETTVFLHDAVVTSDHAARGAVKCHSSLFGAA